MTDKITRYWLDQVAVGDIQGLLADEAVKDIHRATKGHTEEAFHPVVVDILQNGNYTAAIVEIYNFHRGLIKGVGFSKRRPTDKFNEMIGYKIAMRRAVEDAING